MLVRIVLQPFFSIVRFSAGRRLTLNEHGVEHALELVDSVTVAPGGVVSITYASLEPRVTVAHPCVKIIPSATNIDIFNFAYSHRETTS